MEGLGESWREEDGERRENLKKTERENLKRTERELEENGERT